MIRFRVSRAREFLQLRGGVDHMQNQSERTGLNTGPNQIDQSLSSSNRRETTVDKILVITETCRTQLIAQC